jgi:hypothetical protein
MPECHVYQLIDLASALAATEVVRREYSHSVAPVAIDSSDTDAGAGVSAGAGLGASDVNADDATSASSESSTGPEGPSFVAATGQSNLFNAPDCSVVVATDEWLLDAVLASRCANR